MNRKNFLKTIGGISTIPVTIIGCIGCKSLNNLSKDDYEKLKITLEQVGLAVSVKLKSDPDKAKYLKVGADIIDEAVADGQLDPSDVLSVILKRVKNSDVVLALTSAITIYRIWFNDVGSVTFKNEYANGLLSALAKGVRDGLMVQDSARSLTATSKPEFTVPTFRSKSLQNAIKDHFEKYK